MSDSVVVVVGQGEIGKPLQKILSRTYQCIGVDVEPVEVAAPCSTMHICYPYQIPDFVGTTAAYIRQYEPDLTIIHSTVVPGTTRRVYEELGAKLAYSPARGKHVRMEEDLLRYKKFVAGIDEIATVLALEHLAAAGFRMDIFRTPEIGELAKLVETTWLGILIGWAQEAERFAESYGASFDEVNAFIQEVDFLPSHIFPGWIGGHCVMPNIELLQQRIQSQFLDAVVLSNAKKEQALLNSLAKVG
jgi:UDP-N-acetyl-D-mannosaminuronate dehydrogenase